MIGRWSELLIDSASLPDIFADQLLPQREMSRVLSFPVIRLVRVAKPSIKICRSFWRTQSRILLAWWSNITSLCYHYYTCPLIKLTNITSLHYNYHMCSILILHYSNIISHYAVSIHLLIPSKIQLLRLPSIFCTRSKISLMFHLQLHMEYFETAASL